MIWTLLRGYLVIAGVCSLAFLYLASIGHLLDCAHALWQRRGLRFRFFTRRSRPHPAITSERAWLSVVVKLPVVVEDR